MCPTHLRNITGRGEEARFRAEGPKGCPPYLPPKNMRVLLDSCVSSMVSETLEGTTETPVVALIVTYKVWPSSSRLLWQPDQPASEQGCWAPRPSSNGGQGVCYKITPTNIMCNHANLCTVGKVDPAAWLTHLTCFPSGKVDAFFIKEAEILEPALPVHHTHLWHFKTWMSWNRWVG